MFFLVFVMSQRADAIRWKVFGVEGEAGKHFIIITKADCYCLNYIAYERTFGWFQWQRALARKVNQNINYKIDFSRAECHRVFLHEPFEKAEERALHSPCYISFMSSTVRAKRLFVSRPRCCAPDQKTPLPPFLFDPLCYLLLILTWSSLLCWASK